MKFEKGRVFDVAHMIDYAEGGVVSKELRFIRHFE